MKENEKTVVVLSRNYSTGLSVIRSLGSAGYTVDLVMSTHKEGSSEIAAASKYVRSAVEVVSKKVKGGRDTELIEALLKYVGKYDEKLVLFPTDDYTASVMDGCRSLLEDTFIMPSIVGGGDGALTALMDKTVQGDMARKAGLLTPREWMISLEDGVEIPDDMVYPCFAKPVESISGYKTEMAKCENEEELLSHLKKLRRRFASRSILVQEFLEIDNEIDLGGVCLDEEIIIPAIIKKTNVAQYEKGVTLAGRVVPFEELGEVQKGVIDMLRQFHYVGMFDMELNIVGDKIYFNEVNLRSGGPNYSYFKSGVNLPALFVKEAFGERHSPEEEKVACFGKQFIYEKVAWEDHIHGFMSKKELRECIEKADITLLNDESDPRPGEIFEKKIKWTAVKYKLRTIKRVLTEPIKAVLGFVLPPLRAVKNFVLRYPQTKRINRRDPHSEKPRVLVIGRNYCSNLSMARSLGEAGYEVEVMRVFQKRPRRLDIMKKLKPDAYSKYIKAYYVCVSNRISRRIVNRLIKTADPDRKMLLIPTCDLTASVIDDNYCELSDYYVMPNVNNKEGELSRLMSKGVQKKLAEEYGLPVLGSCVVSRKKGVYEIPYSVKYPCFIKPNVSKNSAKSRMRRCDSREELRAALDELPANKNIEMLVEDYVDIGKEYSLLGLSTQDGVIGPGFFVAEEGGQNEHRGVAVVGRMLPTEDRQELIDKLIGFVKTLGYNGLYDIDLIETKDGKMYFVEVNMRYGASGYAVTKCGANLPGMFADYMLFNKPIDLNCRVSDTDKLFVSEKVLVEEYIKGRLTGDDVKECMEKADICFIRNDDDEKPYRHFRRFRRVAALTRQYDKLKNVE